MTEHDIDTHLRQTFDDQRLSRGERRALQKLVENPPELKLRVRRRAFALAQELAATTAPSAVLDWLEDIVKALTEAAVPSISQDAFFAPREDIPSRIIHTLDMTQNRADLAVFTITDDRVTRAIHNAHVRGVAIRIITDNDKSGDLGSDIASLARAGIAVRIDRTEVHMHHKFAVFDGRILLNGSYNWTRSAAQENHENIVLSRDASLVAAFEREFEHCWALGDAY